MMTDKERIVKLYKEMYAAMINKDRAKLERIRDDTFALIHMTGMSGTLRLHARQHIKGFLCSIKSDIFNRW